MSAAITSTLAGIGQPDATTLFTREENSSSLKKFKRWETWVIPYVVLPELLSGFKLTPMDGAGKLTMKLGEKAFSLTRPNYSQTDIEDVIDKASLRNERAAEIIAQAQSCLPFWGSLVPIDYKQTPFTMMVMDVAYEFIKTLELCAKHEFACRRPVELSPQVQPMIITPGHGGFPVGHMAEATLFGCLLGKLTEPKSAANKVQWAHLKTQFDRLADRIGDNRVVAGVHFTCDLAPSKVFGIDVAEHFSKQTNGGGTLKELWDAARTEMALA